MTQQTAQEKQAVLIVDDQPANIHVLGKLIKDDYKILAATSGAKALEIANSENKPDLILLDIMMPEMDGYEVCRRLKANERTNSIPVIFVTARDSPEDEEMGLNLGAVDYISKPFRPTIVRVRVKNHMNLKIKTDMLEKLSLQDGLTNIPNRRFFTQSLDREWARAMRNSLPLSLVMMDIDNFKPYNDNYGHGAGDECLQRVARALNNPLKRPMDLVARYGGEEFVALLPETDVQGAMHAAQGMRAAVEALAIPHEYSQTASVVTMSMGVATHAPNTPQEDAEGLLKAADRALYRSKEKGRNQVQTA
ncbi:MAG: diguanylate cyclase [Desulfovermiculus sp.]